MSAHRWSVVLVAAAAAATTLAACGTASTSTNGTTAARTTTARTSAAADPGPAPGAERPPAIDRVPAVDPLPTPRTALHSGVCLATLGRTAPKRIMTGEPNPSTPPATRGLVTVDPDPIGVVGIWLPGLDTRPCHWSLAQDGAAAAQRLATDIRSAPAFPPGGVSCPSDDGSRVDLYFRYPGERATEHVSVGLRGCVEISAPDAQPRHGTPKLLRDLGALSPRPLQMVLPRK